MSPLLLFCCGMGLQHLPAIAAYLDGARDEADRVQWLMGRPIGTLENMGRIVFIGKIMQAVAFMAAVGQLVAIAMALS